MRQDDKPSMLVLFSTALRYTKKEDKKRNSETLFELRAENGTFHERAVSNFIILASGYYEKEEIREWMVNNLLNNKEDTE